MVIIGGKVTTIQHTGKLSDLNAFPEDFGMMPRVPNVKKSLHMIAHTQGGYFFVAQNSLYVESMDHNLVPPFFMNEAGFDLNKRSKIHLLESTKQNNSIWDAQNELCIHLQLCGMIMLCSAMQKYYLSRQENFFSFRGSTHTLQLLVKKVIYQICVNLLGMNAYIFMIILQEVTSPFRRMFLDVVCPQLMMKEVG